MLSATSQHEAAHAGWLESPRGPDHHRLTRENRSWPPIHTARGWISQAPRRSEMLNAVHRHQAAHAGRSSLRVGLTTTEDRKLDHG